MNWSFLIAFVIGLGCYFVAMGIFVLIKFFINKKKFKKECEDHKVETDGKE